MTNSFTLTLLDADWQGSVEINKSHREGCHELYVTNGQYGPECRTVRMDLTPEQWAALAAKLKAALTVMEALE